MLFKKKKKKMLSEAGRSIASSCRGPGRAGGSSLGFRYQRSRAKAQEASALAVGLAVLNLLPRCFILPSAASF